MLKFEAYEARKKFDITDSSVQIEEDHYASPSNQEYQKLEGKLKHDLTRELSERDWGVIGEQSGSDQGGNTGSAQ